MDDGDAALSTTTRYIYLFIFYIFQTSTLWSYAAVFSQTGASIVSPALVTSETGVNRSAANITCTGPFDAQCATLYYIFLSVFAVCEVIMTVVGLKEQVRGSCRVVLVPL